MGTPKKILIIEDSKFTTEMIRGSLEKVQYMVESCATGPEGLTRARSFLPDLVILDVVMPGMDGFEVCRQLKGEPVTKDVPIMMLTVKDTLDDLQRGFQVRADYYMTKPFTEALLLSNIQKIFSERQKKDGQKGQEGQSSPGHP